MAKSILEELVTVLGYEIDDDDLKKFNKQVESAKQGMKAFSLVATASAAAISIFLNSVASATTETARFAERIGVSFESVQRLTHATELWGGSIADVRSSLTSLTRLASTAARGAGGGEIFGFLGISPTANGRIKDSVTLLKEIADATSKIESEARRVDLLSQLGISERMVLLLRQGSEGIEKLEAELDQFGFVLTEEQAENAERFVMATVRAKAAVKGLGNEIGLRLTPRLTEGVEEFLAWVEANKALVDSDLDVWIANLEKLIGPAKIVGGVLAAMFVGANLANIAIGTLLATFGVLVDDINKFRKAEGETLTGKASDRLREFGLGTRKETRGLRQFIDDVLSGKVAGDLVSSALSLSRAPLLVQPGAAAGGATTINNTLTVDVSGARDPRATGIAVVDQFSEFLRGEFSGVTVPNRT